MALIIKTVKDILPLSKEAIARLDKLKEIRDEDIDTSDMPELTRDQLARMHRVGNAGVSPFWGMEPGG